jgi:hypothetical protein
MSIKKPCLNEFSGLLQPDSTWLLGIKSLGIPSQKWRRAFGEMSQRGRT